MEVVLEVEKEGKEEKTVYTVLLHRQVQKT